MIYTTNGCHRLWCKWSSSKQIYLIQRKWVPPSYINWNKLPYIPLRVTFTLLFPKISFSFHIEKQFILLCLKMLPHYVTTITSPPSSKIGKPSPGGHPLTPNHYLAQFLKLISLSSFFFLNPLLLKILLGQWGGEVFLFYGWLHVFNQDREFLEIFILAFLYYIRNYFLLNWGGFLGNFWEITVKILVLS